MFDLTLFSHIRKCGKSVATRRCDDRTGKCTLLKHNLVSWSTSGSEEHFLWFLHKQKVSTVCPLWACRAETESLAVSPGSRLLSELTRVNIYQANDVPAAELRAGCQNQLRSTVSTWPVKLPAGSPLPKVGDVHIISFGRAAYRYLKFSSRLPVHSCRHALVTGCTPSQGRVWPTVWERGFPTADMQYHASSSACQTGAFVVWFWINPNGKSFLFHLPGG